MLHYTLNTGHSRTSPRDEVAVDVLATMRPLTQPGEHSLGAVHASFADYRLLIPEAPAGLVATLSIAERLRYSRSE
jgi:hypothetical protein